MGGPAPDRPVRASRAALWTDLGGEVAVLLPEDGRMHLLTGGAAALWPLLSEERTPGELCRLLGEEFRVDHETCLRQVGALLGELAALGLLEMPG